MVHYGLGARVSLGNNIENGGVVIEVVNNWRRIRWFDNVVSAHRPNELRPRQWSPVSLLAIDRGCIEAEKEMQQLVDDSIDAVSLEAINKSTGNIYKVTNTLSFIHCTKQKQISARIDRSTARWIICCHICQNQQLLPHDPKFNDTCGGDERDISITVAGHAASQTHCYALSSFLQSEVSPRTKERLPYTYVQLQRSLRKTKRSTTSYQNNTTEALITRSITPPEKEEDTKQQPESFFVPAKKIVHKRLYTSLEHENKKTTWHIAYEWSHCKICGPQLTHAATAFGCSHRGHTLCELHFRSMTGSTFADLAIRKIQPSHTCAFCSESPPSTNETETKASSWSHICSVCKKEANNQLFIGCGACPRAYHATCIGLSCRTLPDIPSAPWRGPVGQWLCASCERGHNSDTKPDAAGRLALFTIEQRLKNNAPPKGSKRALFAVLALLEVLNKHDLSRFFAADQIYLPPQIDHDNTDFSNVDPNLIGLDKLLDRYSPFSPLLQEKALPVVAAAIAADIVVDIRATLHAFGPPADPPRAVDRAATRLAAITETIIARHVISHFLLSDASANESSTSSSFFAHQQEEEEEEDEDGKEEFIMI